MTLTEAKTYINQAREFLTLEWISLSGGEPFLLPDMLVELVSCGSNFEIRTECVTNCFWAYTEQIALKRLRRLSSAGLDVINISVDDFHQEFIPFKRVRNCFNAAKKTGLKIVIMCVISNSSKLRAPEIVERLGDKNIHIHRSGIERPCLEGVTALLVETGFLPAGRATTLPLNERVLNHRSIFEGGCPFVLRDIAVTPAGRVLACCSAGALTNSLDIGNVKNQRLWEIIEDANRRQLIKKLALEGPRSLFKRLDPNVQVEWDEYINKCHLCFETLSDPRLGDVSSL